MSAPQTLLDNWNIAEADFPKGGKPGEQLRFLLKYAVLAPSTRNTQPWAYKILDATVELHADRARILPVIDPQGRELIISCGASLAHLRLAIRHFGYTGEVKLFPDPDQPDLLARVRMGVPCVPTDLEQALFQAIPNRHTNREPFDLIEVPDSVLSLLKATAEQEGVWLHFVHDIDEQMAVANLIWEADRVQWANQEFRNELSEWLTPNRGDRRDGVPGYAIGVGNLMSYAEPLVTKKFNLGRSLSEKDRKRALVSPALALLGTEGDLEVDWLRTGEAVGKLLLLASALGVATSFFNQPIEVPELRPQLRAALVETGFPQLLLRIGYGPEVKPTPRREVGEITQESTGRQDNSSTSRR